MVHRILSVNPGSTSTKVALYSDENPVFVSNIVHRSKELDSCVKITDQLCFRLDKVMEVLSKKRVSLQTLSTVVGRGGLLPPIDAGGYLVNESMKKLLLGDKLGVHASNLGALIADAIAKPLNIPAFIYDAVSADEFNDLARITGIPEIKRQSFCHVLNSKAMCRKYALMHQKRYEDLTLLAAHLGGGISISAHQKGRIIDSISDDGGPFAPDRSGCVPLNYIVDLCFSGRYTESEIKKKIRGGGGLKALLGTADCEKVEKRIAMGDKYAMLVYQAMGYQIAKGIGNLCTVFDYPIDAIILTGGVAYSDIMIKMVTDRVKFIAPVEVLPGENEMEALTLGVLRILRGEEAAKEYIYHQL